MATSGNTNMKFGLDFNQDSTYIHASTAPAYEPEKTPERHIEKGSNSRPVSRRRKKSNRLFSLFTCAGFVCCAFLTPVLFKYNEITAAGIKVTNLENEIAKMSANLDNLNLELECSLDIAKIQAYAANELNMGYADEDQLVGANFLDNTLVSSDEVVTPEQAISQVAPQEENTAPLLDDANNADSEYSGQDRQDFDDNPDAQTAQPSIVDSLPQEGINTQQSSQFASDSEMIILD